jgi:ABC-type bacteriocin/lantibiotic exporter with double-glycine peptidase domain
MKLILQQHANDCGVACIAMLIQRYAGCPAKSAYDAARAVMFGLRNCDYTTTRQLKNALLKLDVPVGRQTVPIKNKSQIDISLEFDAILKTEERKDATWHWMVWDAKNQKILDPLGRKNRRRISHYLRVG